MRHVTGSKGFRRRGGVHLVRQSVARLYNPRPARATETAHIIAPQPRIELGHRDEEIIVASCTTTISRLESRRGTCAGGRLR